MRVLGIMSGTSLDGVDYVVCSIARRGAMQFEKHWHAAFPRRLKERLFQAATGEARAHEVGQLHHDLGRFYAKGALREKIDLVGLHGQTIFHRPHRSSPATLQIGEPAYLAEALKAPVVANFRAADLAAGGQGAPLATIFHRHVFARKGAHVAVNNLGGISNVTSLDWRKGAQPRVLAFDTGPANMLIDLAARAASAGQQACDRGGSLARRGSVCEELVQAWLSHPFFKARPPKSTGREMFGSQFFAQCEREANERELSAADLAASLTELTAQSLALNYRLHLPAIPDDVVLCGGGAENPYLRERIAGALRVLRSDVVVRSSAELGWTPQVIEAAAFALLAWLRWNDQAGNLPETTGAAGPRLLGQIVGPL